MDCVGGWDKVALGVFVPSERDLMDCASELSGTKWLRCFYSHQVGLMDCVGGLSGLKVALGVLFHQGGI